MEVKGSLDHVAAVATTMDQTGVVLHFVEVRIIIPPLPSCFHQKSGVERKMNPRLQLRPHGNHSRQGPDF